MDFMTCPGVTAGEKRISNEMSFSSYAGFFLLFSLESNNDQVKPVLYDGWVSKLIKSK